MPTVLSRSNSRRNGLLASFLTFAAVAACGLAGCGGGGDSPTGGTGNNNGNGGNNGGNNGGGNSNVVGPPASISVESGDQQSAEPRQTVATPIVVIVRDSISRAVVSATVTVVVDSGGGALSSQTATTGSDGRATLSAWTLGAAEGAQVLRVSAGSASTKARATARIASTTLPVLNAPAAGGTVTVNQTGSSLNGLTITVQSGSYPTARPITLSYASASGVTPPVAGATIVSPLISVSGLDVRATKEMTMKLPARIPAGQTPIVVIKNPASKVSSTLRLLSWDSTSVTVSFHALNGAMTDEQATIPTIQNAPSLLRGIRAPSSLRASAQVAPADPTGPAQVYTITIPDAEIFKARATGFKLEDDAWNFAAIPTILDAFTQRGMAATALYWFTNLKQRVGSLKSRLWLTTVPGEAIPYGSWQAMRLVSQASLPDVVLTYGTLAQQKPSIDADFRSIAASMLISEDKPVPVWVISKNASMVRVVLATTIVTQGGIAVYDPLAGNSDPGLLVFEPQTHAFLGYLPPKSTTLDPDVILLPSSLFAFYDRSAMLALAGSATTSTFGDDKWPSVKLRSQFDSVKRTLDTVWVVDTLSMWSECASCAGKGTPATFNPNPAPANGEVLPSWFWAKTAINGPMVSISGNTIADLRGGFRLNSNLPRIGSALFIETGVCGAPDPYNCWIDARYVPFVLRAQGTITGAAATVKPGSTVNLSVALSLAPANAEVEWDYGDASPRDKKGTAIATSHVYADTGKFVVKVRTYHPRTKQLTSLDSAFLTVSGCADTFVDARDNITYKQVCVGTQKWMGENLRYVSPGSRCYADQTSQCTIYGRLYEWTSIMNGGGFTDLIPSGVRGLCPAGWHVPSMSEWDVLLARFGGRSAAGLALIQAATWTFTEGTPTNASGMSIVAAGGYGGTFPPPSPGYYGRSTSTGLATTTMSTTPNWPIVLGINGSAAVNPSFSDPSGRWYSLRCVGN